MRPTVYIIDDDEAVRTALSLLVRSNSWFPEAFASAESFLSEPMSDGDACMLLDLDMPGMNGAELCEHLRRTGIHIPVLIVTAHQDHPLARRALAAGAAGIVPKPFNGDELLQTLRELLEL